MRNTLKQAANTKKPVRKLEKEWTMNGRVNRIVPCVGSQGMIMGFFLIRLCGFNQIKCVEAIHKLSNAIPGLLIKLLFKTNI